jgi:acetylornithine/N-succinyldiaminopimelate aminotransferase
MVEQALAEGVLFNVTQDTVLRFLPPFLLQEKHVDKGIRVLKKLLGKKRGKSPSVISSPIGALTH